jgi:hypothetical protein
MTPNPREDDQLRQWVENWKRLGPLLEEIRDRELLSVDTTAAIQALSGLARAARLERPPHPTSGLVEQQRYFRRLRAWSS